MVLARREPMLRVSCTSRDDGGARCEAAVATALPPSALLIEMAGDGTAMPEALRGTRRDGGRAKPDAAAAVAGAYA